MKYDNIEKIRNMLLSAMEKVESGKMEAADLMIMAKSSEGVFSSLKLQMAYAHMHGEKAYIPFLDDCHMGVEPEPKKLLSHKKEK